MEGLLFPSSLAEKGGERKEERRWADTEFYINIILVTSHILSEVNQQRGRAGASFTSHWNGARRYPTVLHRVPSEGQEL